MAGTGESKPSNLVYQSKLLVAIVSQQRRDSWAEGMFTVWEHRFYSLCAYSSCRDLTGKRFGRVAAGSSQTFLRATLYISPHRGRAGQLTLYRCDVHTDCRRIRGSD